MGAGAAATFILITTTEGGCKTAGTIRRVQDGWCHSAGTRRLAQDDWHKSAGTTRQAQDGGRETRATFAFSHVMRWAASLSFDHLLVVSARHCTLLCARRRYLCETLAINKITRAVAETHADRFRAWNVHIEIILRPRRGKLATLSISCSASHPLRLTLCVSPSASHTRLLTLGVPRSVHTMATNSRQRAHASHNHFVEFRQRCCRLHLSQRQDADRVELSAK